MYGHNCATVEIDDRSLACAGFCEVWVKVESDFPEATVS